MVPHKLETYRKRSKLKYLAKGEALDKPIKDRDQEVLSAANTQTMWDNTHIFVAFPEKNNWHKAVEAWLKLPA